MADGVTTRNLAALRQKCELQLQKVYEPGSNWKISPLDVCDGNVHWPPCLAELDEHEPCISQVARHASWRLKALDSSQMLVYCAQHPDRAHEWPVLGGMVRKSFLYNAGQKYVGQPLILLIEANDTKTLHHESWDGVSGP